MTELLYQTDSYIKEFEAVVTAIDEERHAVLLDRTAFYPGGGGQPNDVGELDAGGQVYVVTKAEKGNLHVIENAALPAVGTKVRGILLHTDAAQSAGKIPVNVDALGVDLLTLAGHKLYAPKGVGALYVRTGTPTKPIHFGADQEHGLRPGTENVPQVVGLGAAARLARERLPAATEKLRSLRDALHQRLATAIPGLLLNGHPIERLPTTLHVSFPGIAGRELLSRVAEQVAASLGSACHSEADAVSGVLAAMGCDAGRALGAVRFSVGWMTTPEEIEAAAAALSEGVKDLLAPSR